MLYIAKGADLQPLRQLIIAHATTSACKQPTRSQRFVKLIEGTKEVEVLNLLQGIHLQHEDALCMHATCSLDVTQALIA